MVTSRPFGWLARCKPDWLRVARRRRLSGVVIGVVSAPGDVEAVAVALTARSPAVLARHRGRPASIAARQAFLVHRLRVTGAVRTGASSSTTTEKVPLDGVAVGILGGEAQRSD